jgi:hypothetical protein
VGGVSALRVSIPAFLSEIPKVRVVLDWIRKYLRDASHTLATSNGSR